MLGQHWDVSQQEIRRRILALALCAIGECEEPTVPRCEFGAGLRGLAPENMVTPPIPP